LGDKFAVKGFAEDGLGELVNVRFRFAVTRLEFIGGCEKRFDAPDDLLLFSKRRQWYNM
jgi:hypothetical protein